MDEIYNERLKLTATFLNIMAALVVVSGGFVPLLALYFTGASDLSAASQWARLGTSFFAGLATHLLARYVLGGLRT